MYSNMLCGFYQNTDPKSSFTYCFIISYSIDEIYYILYVKEDTLDYIVVYKEQVDKWYKPVSKRSIIDNGYEKFVKFITDVMEYNYDLIFHYDDEEDSNIDYYYNQRLMIELEPLKTVYFYLKDDEWRNFENYKERLELAIRMWNDIKEQDTFVIYKTRVLETDAPCL